MDICVICNEGLISDNECVQLRQKGCNGINKASLERGDCLNTIPGQFVHIKCRKDYCNPNVIKRDQNKELPSANVCLSPTLRSRSEQFSFKDKCLFCGQRAKLCGNKRGLDIFPVRTLQFQTVILNVCKERADDWSMEVTQRLNSITDLPAADAIYHQICSVNFRTMKSTPVQFSHNTSKRFLGRPIDSQLEKGFQYVVKYLEDNDDEQITVRDLVDKMTDYCGDDAYSVSYMKQKLKEHFGESLIVTEIKGKNNVVTLHRTATSILHDFYHRQKDELDSEAKRMDIINTAGKLIRADICSKCVDKELYPSPVELASVEQNVDYLSDSLKLLLQTIVCHKASDLKLIAIGQAIMQAARPRTIIAPLQIGLGVQLHHQFASKFLIDTLNTLGFCSSYREIQKFESSAAVATGTDISNFIPGSFVQYVADNVDHNVRTLDGQGTFHGMGIIACVTPGTFNTHAIKRACVTKEDIQAAGNINIHYYTQPNETVKIRFNELSELRATDSTKHLDNLVKLTWTVRPLRPGWSGLMQLLQQGENPGKSSVAFMPMIDMPPSNMSCIYTTLQFVSDHAARHGVHPILTFDQPLYWKALTIVRNEPDGSDISKIVLRLGGFHTLMSFLGSIGHIMNGSGLSEVLETVYAPNAVVHMLSGKAIARAVRGHLLVDRALSSILIKDICSVAMTDDENNNNNNTTIASKTVSNIRTQIELFGNAFDDLVSGKRDVHSLNEVEQLTEINQIFVNEKEKLRTYRTAALWIQYLEMVEIMQSFIKAERKGDWHLHLYSVSRMLPYFAATGHNLYLKSAYIYLQTMQNLTTTNTDVHEFFNSGHHVVRRSDRHWAGLSTDLMIEQVLMRSVKTNGGLTRGKGITESQRTQWLLSLPTCAEINRAVQDLCGTSYETSDQHKEFGKTRQERDMQDTNTILEFIRERQPFNKEFNLRNIETGVMADSTVNVDNSKEIGEKIVENMIGKCVTDYTFKKCHQAVTMKAKTAVRLDDESIHVDPQLLFQRLTTAITRSTDDDISRLFEFELCSVPPAFFDNSGLPRQPQKSTLADAIWHLGDCSLTEEDNIDVQHVLDGGSLLHLIPWQSGTTYREICKTYSDYIVRKYTDPVIVFDGYDCGPTTKDITHIRRNHGIVGSSVSFKESTPFKGKKESFLTNSQNKQKFINLLSNKLELCGCTVINAVDDADRLIVKTAVSCAKSRDIMLIGEDTDLLVLLCYHVCLDDHKVYFKSGRQNGSKPVKVWDIQNTKNILGEPVCHALPFLHAITGCDTTSHAFGLSKGSALKKLLLNNSLQKLSEVFNARSKHADIENAGENALVILYGGIEIEGLNILRFRKFVKKATSNTTSVQVQTLPPTAATARFHSYRVYFQVQQWIDSESNLQPLDWGWAMINNKLIPIKTDRQPAPDTLLNIIKCNCKSNCDSRKCTCRKHGLECTVGCGQCRGISCTNVSNISEEDLADDM